MHLAQRILAFFPIQNPQTHCFINSLLVAHILLHLLVFNFRFAPLNFMKVLLNFANFIPPLPSFLYYWYSIVFSDFARG